MLLKQQIRVLRKQQVRDAIASRTCSRAKNAFTEGKFVFCALYSFSNSSHLQKH
ncbi:hypothetical protein SAMN05661012_03076 [Chitinophaga sancti]|uniref:Uncharacterized protein n=1 Tax=Chitinophaga sancti TaxID=1004 RepID=A0A1K1QUM8_9BACT|nr:hypothetical protein SAMN05661012_03076 [Chitinophaga sancti]